MAWGREPSKQDILRLAIVAMIKAEVPSVEDDCAGWSLSNEDFKFKLKGTYGRGDSKVRVSVSLRGLSFPHDTPPPRDPFFVASTVEDAKEKLNNKLLPAAKALREQCIEARGARAVRVARILEEYARGQKLFDGIPNVEVSHSYSGSITIKTKAGIDVSITNYKGFWQMTLHAPVDTSPEAALDLVKLLNGGEAEADKAIAQAKQDLEEMKALDRAISDTEVENFEAWRADERGHRIPGGTR